MAGKRLIGVCLWFVLASLGPGCSEKDSASSLEKDLGSEGRILLPTQSAWLDTTLGTGSADWVPYKEPGAMAEGTSDEDSPSDDDAIKEEIRAIIVDYNAAGDERDIEGLIEYHVVEEAEKIRPLFEAAIAMQETMAKLKEAMKEQLPDESARIDEVFDVKLGLGNEILTVESLEVVSESEVIGTLPSSAMTKTCRFLLQDGDWYIQTPDLPDPNLVKPQLDMMATQLDAMIAQVSSAAIAGQVLSQLEIMAAAMKSAADSGSEDVPPSEEENP